MDSLRSWCIVAASMMTTGASKSPSTKPCVALSLSLSLSLSDRVFVVGADATISGHSHMKWAPTAMRATADASAKA